MTPPVPPAAGASPDPRLDELHAWLAPLARPWALATATLRPASSDASFRRYFRVDATGPIPSFIVMDAPPDKEDCRPFVRTAALIGAQSVSTPQVLQSDLERGFLLLTDLGSTTYFDALRAPAADAAAHAQCIGEIYAQALEALVRMQGAPVAACEAIPPYDRARLAAELQLFPDWYVERHLGMRISERQRAVLAQSFERLLDRALSQPSVLVHRDYHSRNLMVLGPEVAGYPDPAARPHGPGVLDFQDAVMGPPTYDLVSLLRDAYVDWPEERQIDWAVRYWELARARALPVPVRFDAFWRDMEWMGLQRSLKILGIFARLYHRDGKDRYLADLPLVLRQAESVIHRYDELAPLGALMDELHQRHADGGVSF